jgi:hypothetical protein
MSDRPIRQGTCPGCGKPHKVLRQQFGMEHKDVWMCDDCWYYDAVRGGSPDE